MKKILFVVAFLFGLTGATFAENVSLIDSVNSQILNGIKKEFDFKTESNKLGLCLKLTGEEIDYVNYIHLNFCKEMSEAILEKNEQIQERKIFSAVDYELKNMKLCLTKKQYHNFLIYINKSFLDRGFHDIQVKYSVK